LAYGFLELASTRGVKSAQSERGSAEYWAGFDGDRASDKLTQRETNFISSRDSFYMATVSESGWPYVQHRGGPAGFVHVLDPTTLGFADFRGNRQYISIGNLSTDDRVALIIMDYPSRRRLKIYAHAEIRERPSDETLAERLRVTGYDGVVERSILLHLVAFDWNCPQHISPKITGGSLVETVQPLMDRLCELEAENARLRSKGETAMDQNQIQRG
jgi:uncharacterized protein